MMTTRNAARVSHLKSLRFGVELETVGIYDRNAAEAIQAIVGGDLVRGESYLGGFEVRMADGRAWKVVRDSSLHDSTGRACEVVSPILTYSDMDTLQAIVRAVRAAGGRVNETCGMHVHVDGAAFRTCPSKVRNLIAIAYRWESVAVNMAHVIGRRMNYCQTLGSDVIERFRNGKISTVEKAAAAWYGERRSTGHYDSSRYHWINVHALFDKGTVEFRLFNGTLHAGRVKANVLFALGMASTALTMRSVSFRGQTTESRTLPDGRRAVTKHDSRMFLVHVLCLVGDEFATYRKHLASAMEAA
jgi:hypothetical protein